MISAIVDTATFILMVVLCIFAATNAYYVLGTHLDVPFPFYAALSQVFQHGVLAASNLHDFAGVDGTWTWAQSVTNSTDTNLLTMEYQEPEHGFDHLGVQLLFYTLSVSMSVILMNLLIGVLGQNYEIYENLSKPLFIRERARLLFEYRDMCQFASNIFGFAFFVIYLLLLIMWHLLAACFGPCFSLLYLDCLVRCFESLRERAFKCLACIWAQAAFSPEAYKDKRIIVAHKMQPDAAEERSLRLVLQRHKVEADKRMDALCKEMKALTEKMDMLLGSSREAAPDPPSPQGPQVEI